MLSPGVPMIFMGQEFLEDYKALLAQSADLLVLVDKKNVSIPGGVTSARRVASCSSRGWRYTFTCAWMKRPACSRIAATTFGWQCPVLVTAIPLEKSR